jgi:hypothetical protein
VTTPPDGQDGKCNARTRAGGRCKQAAGWDTDHVGAGPCKLHGGRTPTVARGAHVELVERHARELFGKVVPDTRPVDNPLAEFAEFAGRVMAWLDLCDLLLDDVRSVEYRSKATGEQVAARIVLYERAMDRANTVLAAYSRLNIDDRLATIDEQQAKTVMRAIEAVITFLQPDAVTAQQARAIGARHLRAVE